MNLYYDYIKHTKYIGKGSGWVIDSVIDSIINISKYNILVGSSFIKLPKRIKPCGKWFTCNQHLNDNECFKRCLVRYLHPADHHSARI